MALIRCSECGGEISTAAEVCPHCGYRTVRGQTVAQAKGIGIQLVFAIITMLVGIIMLAVNWEDFMDRVDYLDDFKYFSDDGKTSVILFVVGLGILLIGFIQILVLWVSTSNLRKQDYSSEGYTRPPVEQYNPPAPSAFSEYVPTWKRIEMTEKENNQTGRTESVDRKVRCIFCGDVISEKLVFCSTCGRRRD